MYSNLPFLLLGARRPCEVEGPGEAGVAREDEGPPPEGGGAAPEEDAPGVKVVE